jgi:hypothetical protein
VNPSSTKELTFLIPRSETLPIFRLVRRSIFPNVVMRCLSGDLPSVLRAPVIVRNLSVMKGVLCYLSMCPAHFLGFRRVDADWSPLVHP